ncbi:hypothetical protein ABTF76_22685, partial [Acinetobacter baumannii]
EQQIDALAPRAPGQVRIGIICSGNPGNANDARRSIALERFAALAKARDGVSFFIIQPDLRTADAQWLQQAGPQWHSV